MPTSKQSPVVAFGIRSVTFSDSIAEMVDEFQTCSKFQNLLDESKKGLTHTRISSSTIHLSMLACHDCASPCIYLDLTVF